MRWREFALAGLVAVLLSVHSSHSPACGPYFVRAVFSFESFPQLEIEEMVDGRIGVIQPRYWRRFLFLAYRNLTGVPLSAAERAVFLGGGGTGGAGQQPVERWSAALATFGIDAPARLDPYRRVTDSSWQSFLNCSADAFHKAAETLEKRRSEFGADHEGVRAWIEAQQIVFSNCSGGNAIPAAAGSDLPVLLQKDREYQIAAAHFYALNLHGAERRFRAIAEDDGSPWSDWAAYIAVRCLIRRATLDPRPGLADNDMLSRAAHELRQLLADESRREVHPAAQKMLDYLNGRLQPGRRLAKIGDELSKSASSEKEFWRNLTDYQALMDKNAGFEDGAEQSELIAWVVNFQDTSVNARDEAVRRWLETREQVWLVSALSKVNARDPEAIELSDAGAVISDESSAWATATYHRIRLLIESGRRDRARELLDAALPAARAAAPASTRNLFRAQRFELARDFDDLVNFAEREVIGLSALGEQFFTRAADEGKPERQFGPVAVAVLNQGLPVMAISKFAEAPELLASSRREAAIAGLVRALLLEDYPTAASLAPEAGLEWDANIADRFSAALFILKNPALRPYLVTGENIRPEIAKIDSYRDNWWCAMNAQVTLDGWPFLKANESSSAPVAPGPRPRTPDFLTPVERAAFDSEWDRLLGFPTAPTLLGDIVIRHAREHRDDLRVPEALHLAVRATRYGCTDRETTKTSRAAFQLLHRNYPDSEWARKTPYWY